MSTQMRRVGIKMIEMSKEKVLRAIMKSLKKNLPCPVTRIAVFGGVLNKPWPRKDVDVLVKAPWSECWSDALDDPGIDDIIYEVNEKATKAAKKTVDMWVHFPDLGELWHEEGREGVTEMYGFKPDVAFNVLSSSSLKLGND